MTHIDSKKYFSKSKQKALRNAHAKKNKSLQPKYPIAQMMIKVQGKTLKIIQTQVQSNFNGFHGQKFNFQYSQVVAPTFAKVPSISANYSIPFHPLINASSLPSCHINHVQWIAQTVFLQPFSQQSWNIHFGEQYMKKSKSLSSYFDHKIDVNALLNALSMQQPDAQNLVNPPKIGGFWLNEGLLYNTVFIDKTETSYIHLTDNEGILFITLSSRPRLVSEASPAEPDS